MSDKKDQKETLEGKEHFSWKRLLITTSIVVATAGIVFGITWYYLDKSTKESDEASGRLRRELQSEIDELRVKLKDLDSDDSLVYTNQDYGFSLTFPDSWKEYKSYPVKLNGSSQTWYIELPTNNSEWNAMGNSTSEKGYASIFAVSAYTDAQWAANQDETAKSTYLGKKGNYTLGYSRAQSAPDDLMSKFDDLKSILSTFTIN